MFEIEFTSVNVMNNEYAQTSLMQQKNTLEQAIFDDEKRSINALSLFISEYIFLRQKQKNRLISKKFMIFSLQSTHVK